MSKATVVAMGNTSTCSYCRALKALTDKVDFESLMPGADFVYADQAKDAKLYAKWKAKSKMSGNIPVIAVFDGDGVLKGKFVARSTVVKPFTAAQIAAEVADLCPDCCVEGGCGEDEPEEACGCTCDKCGCEVNFCPNCGEEL